MTNKKVRRLSLSPVFVKLMTKPLLIYRCVKMAPRMHARERPKKHLPNAALKPIHEQEPLPMLLTVFFQKGTVRIPTVG